MPLKGAAWREASMALLAKALKMCSQLQGLDMAINSFGDAGAQNLAAALKMCPQLQGLDVSCQSLDFGDAGAESLAAPLATLPALTSLTCAAPPNAKIRIAMA